TPRSERAGAAGVGVAPEGWRDRDQLASEFIRCQPEALLAAAASLLPEDNGGAARQRDWGDAGKAAMAAMTARLAEPPLHEGQVGQALACAVPQHARVVIGSRMPLPDPDTFLPPAPPPPHPPANPP